MKDDQRKVSRTAGLAWRLNPLTVGLFFTACLLFSFSLVFYCTAIFLFMI